MTTRIAGPDGSPQTLAAALAAAQPGDEIILRDGTYTGDEGMLAPPQGTAGTAEAPIIIRAENDGMAIIDGEGTRRPVVLHTADWIEVEGVDACHSNGNVVSIHYSNHIRLRRVCGWDAKDANVHIFQTYYATDVLLEDCVGFGIARKIFEPMAGSDYITFRRCFGQWDGCHTIGPKMPFSVGYRAHHVTIDQCIATWTGGRMQENYDLLNTDGSVLDPVQHFDNYEVQNPYGLFCFDNNTGHSFVVNSKLTNSIGYVKAGANYGKASGLIQVKDIAPYLIENVAVWMDASYTDAYSLILLGYPINDASGLSNLIKNTTAIGPVPPIITSAWQAHKLRMAEQRTFAPAWLPLSDNTFCDFPMRERIVQAQQRAGYETTTDVHRDIADIFGEWGDPPLPLAPQPLYRAAHDGRLPILPKSGSEFALFDGMPGRGWTIVDRPTSDTCLVRVSASASQLEAIGGVAERID